MTDGGGEWQVLAAKDEIRELAATYGHACADLDVFAVVGLFTPDGVLRVFAGSGEGEVYTGHGELTARFSSVDLAMGAKPFVNNHVVELDGADAAHGRYSQLTAFFPSGGEPFVVAGHYIDRYRRVSGQWLFAERDYHHYGKVTPG